jgi:uncharacterized protein YodC (DUF2158 family)
MPEAPFKVGDIVRLRSGGPRMTVRAVDVEPASGEVTVFCNWFARNRIEQGNFPPDTLRDASGDLTE